MEEEVSFFVTYQGKKYYVKNGTLDLRYKEITDIAEIEGLKELINLKVLHLGYNEIQEIKHLENLGNLNELALGFNRITEIKGLEHLVRLQKLYLWKNRIVEIKGLEKLTNLQFLDLHNNQIEELKGLENLTNLEELNLNKNQIAELKGLDNLTNLRILQLDHSPITELKGLERLTNLKKITILDHQLNEWEYEVLAKGAGAVVKYCQEKKMGKHAPIDHIIQDMEQELAISLQHIGKVLGRFFLETLRNYYSAKKHYYPAVKNAEELLKFISEFYTTSLLWPCYRGMIRAEYYSRMYLQYQLPDVEEAELWRAVDAAREIEGELWLPFYEYKELLAFDKEMLQVIEGMSFRKEFVQKWVEKTEKMYQRINRSKTHVSLYGRTKGLKSRQRFVDRYALGDRIKFYGRLRKYMAKELNVPIKDLSAMEKAYSGFWKRWLDNEIRFYDKYWSGRTAQVDPSFWIESDYYALLVKEIIAIIKELLTRLDMNYSQKVKMRLVQYFRNYFREWNYWSFSPFMSWCEKVSSGKRSFEIPLPDGREKERAERERKYKDDLEYHREEFADYIKHFEAFYEKLSGDE